MFILGKLQSKKQAEKKNVKNPNQIRLIGALHDGAGNATLPLCRSVSRRLPVTTRRKQGSSCCITQLQFYAARAASSGNWVRGKLQRTSN